MKRKITMDIGLEEAGNIDSSQSNKVWIGASDMWMNQNVINERTEQLYHIHCDIDAP